MAQQGGVSVTNEREIQPMQLSLEQLNALKTQHEEEIQELQKQMESLHSAKARFATSRATLLDMGKIQNDQKLLVPLSSSLYVPGVVADAGKVSFRVGSFVEYLFFFFICR
jgi:prefoldin alpha subunit